MNFAAQADRITFSLGGPLLLDWSSCDLRSKRTAKSVKGVRQYILQHADCVPRLTLALTFAARRWCGVA